MQRVGPAECALQANELARLLAVELKADDCMAAESLGQSAQRLRVHTVLAALDPRDHRHRRLHPVRQFLLCQAEFGPAHDHDSCPRLERLETIGDLAKLAACNAALSMSALTLDPIGISSVFTGQLRRTGKQRGCSGVVGLKTDKMDLAVVIDLIDTNHRPEALAASDHHSTDPDCGWVNCVGQQRPPAAFVILGIEVCSQADDWH